MAKIQPSVDEIMQPITIIKFPDSLAIVLNKKQATPAQVAMYADELMDIANSFHENPVSFLSVRMT
ncbi:hypothetical protein AT959_06845 [Dechloromonas denitrificans]|uniref:Uncharacterized protein n=1 Tax=Dechloromonas denitrificans TaxID=281362 RepID=A0A133XKB6_9RHOO|nr:hypothetical protein AT959_06845 [Dechloromonas denitrificans]